MDKLISCADFQKWLDNDSAADVCANHGDCAEFGLSLKEIQRGLATVPNVDPVRAAGGCYCSECANMVLGESKDGSPLYWCRKFVGKVDGTGFCAWGAVQKAEKASKANEPSALQRFLAGN